MTRIWKAVYRSWRHSGVLWTYVTGETYEEARKTALEIEKTYKSYKLSLLKLEYDRSEI